MFYRPYVWGAKAMEIQSVRKSLGPSLWKQTTVDEVISLLDQDTLHQSTVHFHLNTSLQVTHHLLRITCLFDMHVCCVANDIVSSIYVFVCCS